MCKRIKTLPACVCVGVEKKLWYNNDTPRTLASLPCATLSWFYLPSRWNTMLFPAIEYTKSLASITANIMCTLIRDATKPNQNISMTFHFFCSIPYVISSVL